MSVSRNADLDTGSAAADLAYQRITEIEGAIDVDINEGHDTTHVVVNLTNVLGASLVTIDWLARHLADATGQDVEEVIVELREYLDE